MHRSAPLFSTIYSAASSSLGFVTYPALRSSGFGYNQIANSTAFAITLGFGITRSWAARSAIALGGEGPRSKRRFFADAKLPQVKTGPSEEAGGSRLNLSWPVLALVR